MQASPICRVFDAFSEKKCSNLEKGSFSHLLLLAGGRAVVRGGGEGGRVAEDEEEEDEAEPRPGGQPPETAHAGTCKMKKKGRQKNDVLQHSFGADG